MEGRLAGRGLDVGESFTQVAVALWDLPADPVNPPSQPQAIVSIAVCKPGTWERCAETIRARTRGTRGRRGKSLGWELCSGSPNSQERFHCVTLTWPSRRAQSLRHLCVVLGLGRHCMLLGRPQPLRRLLRLGYPARCTAERATLSTRASAPSQCCLPRDGREQQHLTDTVLWAP